MSSYGRSPLSSLGKTETVTHMGDQVVKKSCHNDCVQHCRIETMSKPHCGEPACPTPVDTCATPCSTGAWGGVGALLVWFLVIFAITWLILFLLKPKWIMKDCKKHDDPHGHGGDGHGKKHHEEIDTGKLILAAILIALGVVILLWLIKFALNWGK